MKISYEQCYDKAIWLIDNGYSDVSVGQLAEKLFVINNKDEKEKDGNPNLPLNNNN